MRLLKKQIGCAGTSSRADEILRAANWATGTSVRFQKGPSVPGPSLFSMIDRAISNPCHPFRPCRVLSENRIRTYWWCSPGKMGMATITPAGWTVRY